MPRRARRHAELYKGNRRSIEPCEPVCKAVSASISKQTLKQYKMSQRETSCANLYASAVQGDRRCKCRVAFTLAEVLITLTIIGVIAALTIPNLMHKYTEHETVASVKKAYNILSNAYKQATSEYGDADNWEWNISSNSIAVNSDNIMQKYFVPYLKVTKNCHSENGCAANTTVKALNGTKERTNYYSTKVGQSKIQLEDGMYIMLTSEMIASYINCNRNMSITSKPPLNAECGYIDVDINGDKAPNIFGRDIFQFIVTKYGIYPNGLPDSKYGLDMYCEYGTDRSTVNGYACAAWIIQKGNMDYLRKRISW